LLSIEVKFRDGETVRLIDGSRAPDGADTSGLVEDDSQMALPTILGPEQRRPSRDVLFSIRPVHAEKILEGSKTVELRRRFANAVTPGTLALIYSTSPTSALTGSARIKAVQCTDLSTLWRTHLLESARPLERPVGLTELRKRFGFEPPQSYQYASPRIRGLIENERPQAPH
jgi:predicted transcriptional regulator